MNPFARRGKNKTQKQIEELDEHVSHIYRRVHNTEDDVRATKNNIDGLVADIKNIYVRLSVLEGRMDLLEKQQDLAEEKKFNLYNVPWFGKGDK